MDRRVLLCSFHHNRKEELFAFTGKRKPSAIPPTPLSSKEPSNKTKDRGREKREQRVG